MTRNLSRRAWRLKRNGLTTLGFGAAFLVFLLFMLLGSWFRFSGGHLVISVIAGGLLATAVLCLHAGDRAEYRAKAEAAEMEAATLEAEWQVRADEARERRARRAEQLPLEEWDTAITNKPRPQPAATPRPELLRPTPWSELVPGRNPVDANQHNAT